MFRRLVEDIAAENEKRLNNRLQALQDVLKYELRLSLSELAKDIDRLTSLINVVVGTANQRSLETAENNRSSFERLRALQEQMDAQVGQVTEARLAIPNDLKLELERLKE